jgi:hypothetical protein
MASRIELLIEAYSKVINEPWSSVLSGQERVWFLVYDPAEQRKIDLHIGEFELITVRAEKKWRTISFKQCFPTWMASHEYKEEYFNSPEYIIDQLEAEFIPYAIQFLKDESSKIDQDEHTLIALKDVASLFGFARLSEILKSCSSSFIGRVLIFFPGEFEENHYRLLDARDGWDYLARPITI